MRVLGPLGGRPGPRRVGMRCTQLQTRDDTALHSRRVGNFVDKQSPINGDVSHTPGVAGECGEQLVEPVGVDLTRAVVEVVGILLDVDDAGLDEV